MNLLYLIAGVWDSVEKYERVTAVFLRNAKARGYPFVPYAMPTVQFPGYRGLKVDKQLEWLDANKSDYTHVLYTDCTDVLLFGSPAEVEMKYEDMGKPPILVSASHGAANVGDGRYADISKGKYYGFPHCGGYLAEIPLWLDTMRRFIADYPNEGDDCFMWFNSVRAGWLKPVLDSGCLIFQVGDMDYREATLNGQRRPYNLRTDSYPCIWHSPGGSTDPERGKLDRQEPWAKKWGIL